MTTLHFQVRRSRQQGNIVIVKFYSRFVRSMIALLFSQQISLKLHRIIVLFSIYNLAKFQIDSLRKKEKKSAFIFLKGGGGG